MLDLPLDHPPLIVDSFAGGGGASTGIEMALGRSPDIAINHNPAALALHAANHPQTLHLSENVYQVDPLDYLAGRHIGLAWFSPDCKHFSKAKGGKPVERNIRDLAWIVPGWVERIQKSRGSIDIVILENVEEFRDWGPLVETDRGLMPDPERRGQTFQKWCKIIRRLGGRIEWRELRACDYGAPTIRKRLFIIVRFDGQKIVWPKPTHGKPDDPDVIAGRKKPWRVAAEIIDWSLPCPSIFDTTAEVFDKHGLRAVRPLASATMSRVARGVKRYVLDAQKPFLVRTDMASAAGRNGVQDVDAPLNTIMTAGSFATVTPILAELGHGETSANGAKRWGFGSKPVTEPIGTITAAGKSHAVVAPVLSTLNHGGGRHHAPKPVDEPMRTLTAARDAHALLAPSLVKNMTNNVADGMDEPVSTILTGNHQMMIAPILSYAQQGGANRSVEEPAHTITASAKDQNVVLAPVLAAYYGRGEGSDDRSAPLDEPVRTIVTENRHALAVPTLVGCGGRAGQSRPRGGDEPAATITAKADVCVAAAFLAQHNNDSRRDGGVNPGRSADEPVSTITANPQQGVVAAFVSRQFGTSVGHGMEEPTHTATAEVNKSMLVAPHLMTMRNAGKPFNGADEPTHTVTAGGAGLTVVAPFITKYYGVEQESVHEEPLHTATGKARFGHVESELSWPPFNDRQAVRARQVADILRAHGFWDDREFVTVAIGAETFTIVDIGMRMLTPRELFSAQGFPPDYIIELEHNGKPLPKSDQIACCGNSVSPPMARALVAANCGHLMEWREAAE